MKNQIENPTGLHQKYYIQKITHKVNSNYGLPLIGETYTKVIDNRPYITELVPVEENAEYFVLRLDTDGDDINHIKACRIAVHAYADAIEIHIPELAADLREMYPLL